MGGAGGEQPRHKEADRLPSGTELLGQAVTTGPLTDLGLPGERANPPPPRQGKSTGLLTRDRQPGFPKAHAVGRDCAGSVAGPGSTAAVSSLLGRPRRGVPSPADPPSPPRKPGRASGAGTSAPAKGEVEVERSAGSVPAAAGATVPLLPPLPPLLPARRPPRPRACDSPRRRGRLVRAGEAQGSPTRRAANGKLEGEMQIPDEAAESLSKQTHVLFPEMREDTRREWRKNHDSVSRGKAWSRWKQNSNPRSDEDLM
ncbi:vasodilator-stimulated phosphoprotein-like [Bubalus kerabau]|uniref:vasodilator-stimulated phosphoprotein-like n=1 Tax=Bubalus carabanensis TaxID=3119969 RepID=UPI00244EBE60|nr:vasodilator-stimulated phosphoprotein-like [Bubalus carabanensis]